MLTKKMLKSLTFSAVAISMAALPSLAIDKADFDFLTTEHLYNLCSLSPDHGDYAAASYACKGFIEGAVQYHDAVTGTNGLKRLICYPKEATLGDGIMFFNKWAEKHINDKELMSELPVKGLVRGLAEAYPCK